MRPSFRINKTVLKTQLTSVKMTNFRLLMFPKSVFIYLIQDFVALPDITRLDSSLCMQVRFCITVAVRT